MAHFSASHVITAILMLTATLCLSIAIGTQHWSHSKDYLRERSLWIECYDSDCWNKIEEGRMQTWEIVVLSVLVVSAVLSITVFIASVTCCTSLCVMNFILSGISLAAVFGAIGVGVYCDKMKSQTFDYPFWTSVGGIGAQLLCLPIACIARRTTAKQQRDMQYDAVMSI